MLLKCYASMLLKCYDRLLKKLLILVYFYAKLYFCTNKYK